VTASSVENRGTLLASARHLELDHPVVAQEEDLEVEAVVVVEDPLDLAITVASLDICLVTAPRRDPAQTPVHATTVTRQATCRGTAHHLERGVVKILASATNVARMATCPVNAQTLLHNPPIEEEASATHVVVQITLLATVHKRAAEVVVVLAT
jgi:hypothetical protein